MPFTYTYVFVDVSQSTYDEVFEILKKAGYKHAIDDVDHIIDMHGLALRLDPTKSPANSEK